MNSSSCFRQPPFNHPVNKEIEQRYFSDVKKFLNSLKDSANNNKEKNSVVEEVIQSLDNPRSKCPIYLNNLALEIKNNLFEKNPSLFSKDEKETFDNKLTEIGREAENDVNLLLK